MIVPPGPGAGHGPRLALSAKVSHRPERSPWRRLRPFRSGQGFHEEALLRRLWRTQAQQSQDSMPRRLALHLTTLRAAGALAGPLWPRSGPFAVRTQPPTDRDSWPQSAPSWPGSQSDRGKFQASVRIGSVAGWPQSHLRSDLALCGLSMLRRLTMCSKQLESALVKVRCRAN